MGISYKYNLIDMYIKSLGVDIKYKVISGAGEFGTLLYHNFTKANLNIEYFFNDYHGIDKKKIGNAVFIHLEKLKEISDNAFVFISDREPVIYEKAYKLLKENGIKYICPNSLMRIIRFLPENDSNLFPVGHYFSLYPDIEAIKQNSKSIFNKNIEVKEIDFNEKRQLELMNQMIELYPTLPKWNLEEKGNLRYDYNNSWYGAADAVALYCMLRILKPKSLIEVGSGFSSAVTLDTNENYLDEK